MSRSLSDLHPEMESAVRDLLVLAESRGMDLLVTCTLRTLEEQEALYAIGRTQPGRRVTLAKPGQSAHNYGLAVDCVPMVAGKPMWDPLHPTWQQYGACVVDVGLEWAGNWTRFREFPHAQYPGFNWRESLAALKAAKKEGAA